MGVGFPPFSPSPLLFIKGCECMKKLISVLSVVLVLVFSCVLTSFAEGTSILTLDNLSDSRLSVSGNSTVSNGRVTVPAGGSFSAFIRVKPVSATRKYKFSFYHQCTSPVGSSFSLSGSLRIYYKDSSSGDELNIIELTKITNSNLQRYNTLTMPDNFGDSGRIYFVFKNTSSTPFTVYISDFTVNDMTTADLDSAIDKGADKITGAIDPSVPYENFNDGSFKDSADELKEAENALPTVDFGAIDELANSVDVSSYSQAFASINQLFIRVVDIIGITPLIFFACFFGFCIFLIGRKLSGG